MESLDHAMKRGANIIAEYLGGAVTCDAHHMTDPRSDGLGVSTCISRSLEDAKVSPEEVRFLLISQQKENFELCFFIEISNWAWVVICSCLN